MILVNKHGDLPIFYVYIDWTIENQPRPFYVGKGKKSRVRYVKRNKRHTNVLSKHGIEREVVFATLDENAAHDLETELINFYHTYVYDDMWNGIGCNFTLGGEGSNGAKFVWTDEHRQKIALALVGNQNALGMHHSDETKRSISERLKGHDVSDSTRTLISEAAKRQIRSNDHMEKFRSAGRLAKQKAVRQFDSEGNFIYEFESGTNAEKVTGVSKSKICECCKGKRQKAGGFVWMYA